MLTDMLILLYCDSRYIVPPVILRAAFCQLDQLAAVSLAALHFMIKRIHGHKANLQSVTSRSSQKPFPCRNQASRGAMAI